MADSGIDEQQRQEMTDFVLPNDCAFPKHYSDSFKGLTKREYIAALCLQGILANESQVLLQMKAEQAVKYADELIEALNKE